MSLPERGDLGGVATGYVRQILRALAGASCRCGLWRREFSTFGPSKIFHQPQAFTKLYDDFAVVVTAWSPAWTRAPFPSSPQDASPWQGRPFGRSGSGGLPLDSWRLAVG